MGIPDIEQAKLFDRFFRASTSAGVPGTGVGLSIASQLARLLGGQLDFVSRAGIGSTFTLRLPIASASPQVRSRVQNAET